MLLSILYTCIFSFQQGYTSDNGHFATFSLICVHIFLFSYRHGHIDVVKVLVEANCDVNIKNTDGEAPLHFACK